MFTRPDVIDHRLHILVPVSNFRRWRTRWSLFKKFEKYIKDCGAVLWVIEAAFGDREFAVTEHNNPNHIQVRVEHELWLKENLINIGAMRLPHNFKYLGWFDSDISFLRPDIIGECLHTLQHFPIAQAYSSYIDLDSDFEIIGGNNSITSNWVRKGNRIFDNINNCYPYPKSKYPGVPGLAWIAERNAFNQLGGLIDFSILGSSDWHMSFCLLGQEERVINPKWSKGYQNKMRQWANNAKKTLWKERSIVGNVGYVKGTCVHYYHGNKKFRKYGSRDEILIRNQFDPDLDLKRDSQGIYQLTNNNPQLRRDVAKYFANRNEDIPTESKPELLDWEI